MVKIRRASPQDADEIVKLWLELAKYHEKLDSAYKLRADAHNFYRSFLLDLMERGLVLVAEDNGRVVGFLTAESFYNPVFAPTLQGRILDLYVREEYRRRGIGKDLVRRAIEWFVSNGVSCVHVNVADRNRGALEFWKRMRFRVLSHKLLLLLGEKEKL